jgi:hypothetical protein
VTGIFFIDDIIFSGLHITAEVDIDELERLILKGIITREDVNILLDKNLEIVSDVQRALDKAEYLNLPRRETVKLL